MTRSPSCNYSYVLEEPHQSTSLCYYWGRCGHYILVVPVAVRDALYVSFWQEAMLSEGQTEGKGSKQKQRGKKKDSQTTSYTIRNVYVFEKLCQLPAMKALERKAMVLNTSQCSCETVPAPRFKNKRINNLPHKSYTTSVKAVWFQSLNCFPDRTQSW